MENNAKMDFKMKPVDVLIVKGDIEIINLKSDLKNLL